MCGGSGKPEDQTELPVPGKAWPLSKCNTGISNGKWHFSIIETEDGYMLKLESNESVPEDIDFVTEMTVENIDTFDPVNKDIPILYTAVEGAGKTKVAATLTQDFIPL